MLVSLLFLLNIPRLCEGGEVADDKVVSELRTELWEKERKLTDIRLEALSSADRLEQLQDAMNNMQVCVPWSSIVFYSQISSSVHSLPSLFLSFFFGILMKWRGIINSEHCWMCQFHMWNWPSYKSNLAIFLHLWLITNINTVMQITLLHVWSQTAFLLFGKWLKPPPQKFDMDYTDLYFCKVCQNRVYFCVCR